MRNETKTRRESKDLPNNDIVDLESTPGLAIELFNAFGRGECTIGAFAASRKSAIRGARVRFSIRIRQLVQPVFITRRLQALGILVAILIIAASTCVNDERMMTRGLPNGGNGVCPKGS